MSHWRSPASKPELRNAVTYYRLTTPPSPTLVVGTVRWLRTTDVSQRPTEGELKLMALLKDKLNPTYLAVEDVSCKKFLL